MWVSDLQPCSSIPCTQFDSHPAQLLREGNAGWAPLGHHLDFSVWERAVSTLSTMLSEAANSMGPGPIQQPCSAGEDTRGQWLFQSCTAAKADNPCSLSVLLMCSHLQLIASFHLLECNFKHVMYFICAMPWILDWNTIAADYAIYFTYLKTEPLELAMQMHVNNMQISIFCQDSGIFLLMGL